MRVAAVADLHCRVHSKGRMRQLLEGIEGEAEVLVMAGDLTNLGLTDEMKVLLDELSHFSMPKVAVTGNHDHESDQVELLVHMMESAGIEVLDAEIVEIGGVAFVGTKGFCGGFGDCRLQPFGEAMLKAFIGESVHEVVRLEAALESCRVEHKVAVLHYSPVAETLHGESPQVYPFLGFSLFAEALDRHGVDIIVHGHAHHGSPEGFTPGGIPVRNVSSYVLSRNFGCPYALFDV